MKVPHSVDVAWQYLTKRDNQDGGLLDVAELIEKLQVQLKDIQGLTEGMKEAWFVKFYEMLDALIRAETARKAVLLASEPEKNRAALIQVSAIVKWHEMFTQAVRNVIAQEEVTLKGLDEAGKQMKHYRTTHDLHGDN